MFACWSVASWLVHLADDHQFAEVPIAILSDSSAQNLKLGWAGSAAEAQPDPSDALAFRTRTKQSTFDALALSADSVPRAVPEALKEEKYAHAHCSNSNLTY